MSSPAPRRPALPAALGFLAGVAVRGTIELPWQELAPWFAAAVALIQCAGPRRLIPRMLIPCLAALLGARALQLSCDASTRSTRDWLSADGSSVRLDLVGVLATSPERGLNDERRIVLLARPAQDDGRHPDARILLRVMPSARDARVRLDALRAGDAVRLWATVHVPSSGGPDERAFRRSLLARGFDAVGTVKSARLVQRQSSRGGVARILSCAKSAARRRLDVALGTQGAAREMLGAMLLGDRALVSPVRERILRDGGLVHLLSVSGLHVALAIAAMAWLVGCVTHAAPMRLALSLPAIAAITLFVGAGAPSERAGITAMVLLWGRAIGRDGDAVNTLALTAAFLTFLHPPSLSDPSLRLTFSATAGILLFAGRIARSIPIWRPVALSVGVSVAAYSISAPICMAEFGSSSPAAVISNLGGAALCAWVLATGTGAVLLAGLPVVGRAFASAASMGTDSLLGLSSFCAKLPGGALRTATPSPTVVWLYYAALGALAVAGSSTPGSIHRLRTHWLRLLRLTPVVLLGVLHLAPNPFAPIHSPLAQGITANVLDVGQAQSVVIGDPVHGVVLVDAGGTIGARFDAGDRIVARRLSDAGVRRIDVLALTHFHEDHAGGAASILRSVEVGELWLTPGYAEERLACDLAALAVERGVALVLAEDGHRSTRGALSLQVFHPRRGDADLSANDRSLVLRVGAGTRGILIPGDIERTGEVVLLARHPGELTSEFVVVPHHGGRRSSSSAFLKSVRPQVAVASVGRRNRFGHPDPQVLARLESVCDRVYRTDRDGDVRIRWGSAGWDVEPEIKTSPAESGSEGE